MASRLLACGIGLMELPGPRSAEYAAPTPPAGERKRRAPQPPAWDGGTYRGTATEPA